MPVSTEWGFYASHVWQHMQFVDPAQLFPALDAPYILYGHTHIRETVAIFVGARPGQASPVLGPPDRRKDKNSSIVRTEAQGWRTSQNIRFQSTK